MARGACAISWDLYHSVFSTLHFYRLPWSYCLPLPLVWHHASTLRFSTLSELDTFIRNVWSNTEEWRTGCIGKHSSCLCGDAGCTRRRRGNAGLLRTCSCVALSRCGCVGARARCLMKAHERDMETDNWTEGIQHFCACVCVWEQMRTWWVSSRSRSGQCRLQGCCSPIRDESLGERKRESSLSAPCLQLV